MDVARIDGGEVMNGLSEDAGMKLEVAMANHIQNELAVGVTR